MVGSRQRGSHGGTQSVSDASENASGGAVSPSIATDGQSNVDHGTNYTAFLEPLSIRNSVNEPLSTQSTSGSLHFSLNFYNNKFKKCKEFQDN